MDVSEQQVQEVQKGLLFARKALRFRRLGPRFIKPTLTPYQKQDSWLFSWLANTLADIQLRHHVWDKEGNQLMIKKGS